MIYRFNTISFKILKLTFTVEKKNLLRKSYRITRDPQIIATAKKNLGKEQFKTYYKATMISLC